VLHQLEYGGVDK